MIRVDLGKDEVKRGTNKLGNFLSRLNGKSGGKVGKGLGKASISARNLIIWGVALALAYLPHLAFEGYRVFITTEHEQRMKELSDKFAALDQETKRLLPYKQELESYESQRKLVRERIDVVKQLLAGRTALVTVLDAIGQALPKRAWITKSDLKMGDGKPEIVILGQAYENEEISDFVDSLQKSVFITKVVLKNVTKSNIDRVDVRQFTLNVIPNIKPLALPAAPAAPAVKSAVAAPPAPAGRMPTDEGK